MSLIFGSALGCTEISLSLPGCVSWLGAAVVISELEIIRMRMGRVLRLLLSDVVDFRISARLHWDILVFAGCVSLLGAAVVISELEIVRMSMGLVPRLLPSCLAEFRISDCLHSSIL